MTAQSLPQLLLPLRSRAAYREQSFENEEGGIFVAGDVDVDLGEQVMLEIFFVEEQVRFRIRAEVKWRRATPSRRMQMGVGLTFLPSETQTRQQIEKFIAGDDVDHVERTARRYSLHLEIKVDGHGSKSTDDISEGGCFLLWAVELPAIGTRLKVKLQAPGAFFSWITLPATVCWHRTGGDRDGCGVEFLFDNPSDRRRTQKLLGVLRERLGRNVRVQAPSVPPKAASKPPSLSPTPSMLPRK